MNGLVNWNLLAPALNANPGAALEQGFRAGATQGALGRLAQNPGDTRAMNALAAFSPEAAMAMQDRQAQQQAAAAQAQLRQAQAAEQGLENRRNDIIMGASFLEGVTDDAGYQQALQRARSAGVNIEGAPQAFDPQWSAGVRSTAQALLSAQQRRGAGGSQVPARAREIAYFRSIGRNDLADALEYRITTQPVQTVNRDGTITYNRVPVTAPTTGSASPGATPVPVAQDDEYDYFEGGPEQPAPETFPAPSSNQFYDPNAAGGWQR